LDLDRLSNKGVVLIKWKVEIKSGRIVSINMKFFFYQWEYDCNYYPLDFYLYKDSYSYKKTFSFSLSIDELSYEIIKFKSKQSSIEVQHFQNVSFLNDLIWESYDLNTVLDLYTLRQEFKKLGFCAKTLGI